MVRAVLDNEEHLIADDEWNYLGKYSDLSCMCHRNQMGCLIFTVVRISNLDEARYLLVRLCLRKEEKWHRLDQLKYQREIGDPAKIKQAIRQLCDDGEVHEVTSEQEVKREETEIIDLTLDDEDEEPQTNSTAAPVLTSKVEEQPERADLSQTSSSDILDPGPLALAEDETKMTIRELLECLNADELKKFAKQMKLKLTSTVRLYHSIPVVCSFVSDVCMRSERLWSLHCSMLQLRRRRSTSLLCRPV
jgi:Fanconi-associated nuclease 1